MADALRCRRLAHKPGQGVPKAALASAKFPSIATLYIAPRIRCHAVTASLRRAQSPAATSSKEEAGLCFAGDTTSHKTFDITIAAVLQKVSPPACQEGHGYFADGSREIRPRGEPQARLALSEGAGRRFEGKTGNATRQYHAAAALTPLDY